MTPRSRDVALLWAASAVNQAATWVTQVGVFVHVLRDSSTSILAAVQLVGTLPALLWMPFAGALADRRDARTLAVASMAVQTVSLLGLLAALGDGPWTVAGCYGVMGAANALWSPARQRWLYAVVPVEGRAAANASIGSVGGVMTVLGAALGGVLSAWSASGAIAVAAVLQLAALAPVLAVTRPSGRPPATTTAVARRRVRTDLVEGFTALRTLPLARSVIWLGIAWGFVGGAYDVLLADYTTVRSHGGPMTLGAFYVVDGVAVLAGSAVAARLGPRRHLAVYATAYAVQGAAWGAMFLPGRVVVGAALLCVMRTASGVIIALDTTILLATVPDRLRGRITGLHATTYGAVSRLALAAFGGLLAMAGLTVAGVTAGAASVVAGGLWWVCGGRRAGEPYLRATLPATAAAPVRAVSDPAPGGPP